MINLKKIPQIDEIMKQPEIEAVTKEYKRDFVVDMVRAAVDELRGELYSVEHELEKQDLMKTILQKTDKKITRLVRGTLQPVINGTGVVLHTNLGRAPLGERAKNYMAKMASHYNNLEFDLEKGERGTRYEHVEEMLKCLTGAEGALVVNNNAAAVLLGLTTLAKDREVIVSRGQLVEIGGAFRIPEVMKLSGARLVEVGTTNKTYITDFAGAVNENTALLFSAHTSNYKIVGFTEEVSLEAMVALGREKNIPVMQDLGSGILYEREKWKLKEEPTVKKCVSDGVDIITFSGDKLLGGPQAGIIVGKKPLIEAMKKNQLTRALRVDKLTIAALEGTLLEYLVGSPEKDIPIIKMLSLSLENLQERADRLLALLQNRIGGSAKVNRLAEVELEDMVGGGAYPTYKIPGYGIEIEYTGLELETVAKSLRVSNPALLTRKQDNKMLISVRTLLDGDEEIVAELIANELEKEETR